ncbi:hypothetical protein [Kribbella qitaiheensis]|uniref:hypothetical protein n=1 Tax=Kribbella qitaiheensis TaxID=1544730 RepID=UPI001FE8CE8F|nr:hypothetical protein [Kribbella qitaiheensis]
MGDLPALEEMLAEDVVSYADGGGVARASKIPVAGRTRVAAYIKAFAPRFWIDSTITVVEANGRPAALIARDGVVYAMLNIAASEEGIDRLLWVMHPSKLARISTLL